MSMKRETESGFAPVRWSASASPEASAKFVVDATLQRERNLVEQFAAHERPAEAAAQPVRRRSVAQCGTAAVAVQRSILQLVRERARVPVVAARGRHRDLAAREAATRRVERAGHDLRAPQSFLRYLETRAARQHRPDREAIQRDLVQGITHARHREAANPVDRVVRALDHAGRQQRQRRRVHVGEGKPVQQILRQLLRSLCRVAVTGR